MKKTFTFNGFCEIKRLRGRGIASDGFDGEEARARIQVGNKKYFDDDVPCKVTITVEAKKEKSARKSQQRRNGVCWTARLAGEED